MINNRGMLTDEVKKKSKEFLNREINKKELRLYPYLDYCLKNGGYIDQLKIDKEEFEILFKLQDENHLCLEHPFKDSKLELFVTKDFYIYLQEILSIAYVENWLEVKEK